MKIPPSHQPEYRRAYRLANKERIDAVKRAYKEKNKDKLAAQRKKKYWSNPEFFRAIARRNANLFRERHPDLIKERVTRFKQANRKKLAAKQMAYYFANHERELAKHAARRERGREKQRAFARMKSREATDQYVREQLAKYSPLSMRDFPQELVEMKRFTILAKRLLKKKAIHLYQ